MSESVNRLSAAVADRYRIDRELGAGGMATVYLAYDLKHDRDVAIKMLHPNLGAALGGERFLSEIRTTARLQHPHILPLLDSGEADGLLYYVMPLVTGETLRARLEREKQLPIQDALRIAREVASALDYAHRQNVIHRDIKPENILLHDGSALVADFGIALAVQSAGGQRMTQTGLSLGTPQYMSPEQAMGERTIDLRSDVYALGAMTYEMLAGEPPFTGPSAQAIVARILTEQPRSLMAQRRAVPPAAVQAVLRALEKLPADRFESAQAFATALVAPEGSRAPSVRDIASRRRAVVASGAVLATAVIALAAWSGLWPKSAAIDVPVTRVAIALPAAQALRPQFMGFAIGISPDGRRLAYVGPGKTTGTTQIWIRPLDALDAVPLAGTAGAAGVLWSPDGNSMLVLEYQGEGTRVVATSGSGQSIPISSVQDPSWAGDGRVLALHGNRTVVRMAVGGLPDTVFRSDSAHALSHPVALPQGDAILVVRVLQGSDVAASEVVAVTLSTGAVTPVVRAVYARVLRTGELFYATADGNVFVARFDEREHRLIGNPQPLADVAMGQTSGRAYPEFSVSDEGTMVYLIGQLQRQRVVWIDANGRKEKPLDIEGDIWGIALSPNGTRLAYALRDDARATGAAVDGRGIIWVHELATGARTRLTDTLLSLRPSWSPDGKSVLYARVGGPQAIMERRADASEPERNVLTQVQFGHSVGDARWLSDHRTLVVRTYDEGVASTNLYYTAPGTGDVAHPFATTIAEEASPVPSPDGTLVAYISNETGTREIYVQRFPTGGERIVVSRGSATPARWSRDGRSLYYWDQRGHLMIASIAPRPALAVTGTRDLEVGAMPNQSRADLQFDVANDGRIILAEDVPGLLDLVLVRNWPKALAGRR